MNLPGDLLTLQLISIRSRTAAPEPKTRAIVVIRLHALLNVFTFHLRKYHTDIDHRAADRRGCIKIFGYTDEITFILLKLLQKLRKVGDAAADSVKLIADNLVNLAGTHSTHHRLKARPIKGLSRKSVILSVDLIFPALCLAVVCAGLHLRINRQRIFLFNALSGVDSNHRASFSIRQKQEHCQHSMITLLHCKD